MLGHVTKGCNLYNPSLSESEFQYGDWLRASPMKSHRRGAEAEIREERKLYLAFQSEKQMSRACIKLNFNKGPPQSVATLSKEIAAASQYMGVDAMDIAVPGNEVSKRRLGGSDMVRGTEEIRIVHAKGPGGDGIQSKVEVAGQPRLPQ